MRTKHGANRLTRDLEAQGINAAAIHGNKSQGARTKALANFKSGDVRVLVATDIAARGLDIDQLPQVVNFELPNVPEDYVHRIGRTGRAGATGHAISLVCADEIKELQDIEYVIQKHIERKEEPGFEAVNQLPVSRAIKPLKAKKPKKNKSDKKEPVVSHSANNEQKKLVKKQQPNKPKHAKSSVPSKKKKKNPNAKATVDPYAASR